MIAFPQVMASFAMRPWKIRDPKARDHIGVGAFNLIRRSAYEAIGTYEKLRLEVVDDSSWAIDQKSRAAAGRRLWP